jgi:hypothetical protein
MGVLQDEIKVTMGFVDFIKFVIITSNFEVILQNEGDLSEC